MAGVLTRTCAVIGAAAVLAVAGAPGLGHGAESSPAPPGDAAPPWAYDPDEAVPPGDVAARMREEGVPAAVAEQRFRVEHAASELQRRAADSWPATFGGVWIDPAAFAVNVAFTANAAANVAVLAASFPYPGELRSVTVARSYADLVALQDRLRADRGLLGAFGGYDLDVDLPANQAVVRFARVTDEVRERLRSAYGTAVRPEAGLSRPSACDPGACYPTMYGGLDTLQGLGECTAGFTATIGSYRYILSSGHCYKDTGTAGVTHGGTYYGDMTAWQVSGRVDAERVRRLGSGWRESSKFFVWGEAPRNVTAYKLWASVVVGTYVGKTGRATQTTRGYVKSTTYAPYWVPNSSRFITADYCGSMGDSGAPVWSGTTAFGIHSAVLGGTCRGSNGLNNTGMYGVFGSIEYALSALGVTLLSGVNYAPDAAFTWECDMLMHCTFDATSSRDDDGKITTHSWAMGDGSTQSGGAITHDYAIPGNYTVTLTVQDNDGVTDIVSIPVNPPKA